METMVDVYLRIPSEERQAVGRLADRADKLRAKKNRDLEKVRQQLLEIFSRSMDEIISDEADEVLQNFEPVPGDFTESKRQKFIGKVVKTLRQKLDLSQKDLGRLTSFTQPFISAVEAGKQTITYKTIAKLAKAFRVDPTKIDPSLRHIGQKLQDLRTEKGLSRAELAKLYRVHGKMTADRIREIEESGELDLRGVERFADCLGVHPSRLDIMY